MSKQKTSDLELKEISQKLKKALKYSHLSQRELAEKTNIPIGTLRSYLSGNRCPRYENAVKLAEKLGVHEGAFLSSEQKKRENKSESDTFLRKNGAYVSLLRSLNFRCDVIYNKNLGLKCRVARKTMHLDDHYKQITKMVYEYEAGKHPELTNDEINKLYDEYYSYPMQHELENSMTFDLETEEWENFRKEISNVVKGMVNNRIDAAVAEREREKERIVKEKLNYTLTSDLLKTLDAVNAVIDACGGSSRIDVKTLSTLRDMTEKYKR